MLKFFKKSLYTVVIFTLFSSVYVAAAEENIKIEYVKYKFDSTVNEIEHYYPIVSGMKNKNAEEKINSSIEHILNIDKKTYRDWDTECENTWGTDYALYYHITFETKLLSDKYLSFEVHNYMYGWFMNDTYTGYTFDLNTGELIYLENIINDITQFQSYAKIELANGFYLVNEWNNTYDKNTVVNAASSFIDSFLFSDSDKDYAVWYLTADDEITLLYNGMSFPCGIGDRDNQSVKIKIPKEMLLDSNIAVVLNGNKIIFDQNPIIENGRTLVPMRAIFEALGATVGWDDAIQTAIAMKGDLTVKIKINDNFIYKNEEQIKIDVPAKLVANRTLVPVRAISESFGCSVDWDEFTKTVLLKY